MSARCHVEEAEDDMTITLMTSRGKSGGSIPDADIAGSGSVLFLLLVLV